MVHHTQSAQHAQSKEHNTYIVTSWRQSNIYIIIQYIYIYNIYIVIQYTYMIIQYIYIYVYMLPKQGYWISKSFTIIYLKIESYIQLKTHTHM